MNAISVSRVKKYNKCPRWYRYDYIDNIEVTSDEDTRALDVGSIVHNAIESTLKIFNNAPGRGPIKSAKSVIQLSEEYPASTRTEALQVYSAYIDYIVNDLGIYRVYEYEHVPAIELYFELPLTNDIHIKGYIDAIVHNKNGGITLLDWKVNSYVNEIDTIQMDYQLYVYVWAARKLGINVTHAAQVQLIKYYAKQKQVNLQKGLRVMPVDLTHVDSMVNKFTRNIEKMILDKEFQPVSDSNTCRFCHHKDRCLHEI